MTAPSKTPETPRRRARSAWPVVRFGDRENKKRQISADLRATAQKVGNIPNCLAIRNLRAPAKSDQSTCVPYYGYRWYDPLTGRWSSRDPIEEFGGVNLYAFVKNYSIGEWDYLGFQIVAPPDNYLKDGDCTEKSLPEFAKLQQEWGPGLTPSEFKTIAAGGCVGIAIASQEADSVRRGGSKNRMQPEFYDPDDLWRYTECYAGAAGKAKAEEGSKKCSSSTPVVFGKYGKWLNEKTKPADGAKVDLTKNRIIGMQNDGQFDYITRLGNYYLHANFGNAADPSKVQITMCKNKVPERGGYPNEMWCFSCCAKGDKNGYNDGYAR